MGLGALMQHNFGATRGAFGGCIQRPGGHKDEDRATGNLRGEPKSQP